MEVKGGKTKAKTNKQTNRQKEGKILLNNSPKPKSFSMEAFWMWRNGYTNSKGDFGMELLIRIQNL